MCAVQTLDDALIHCRSPSRGRYRSPRRSLSRGGSRSDWRDLDYYNKTDCF